MVFLYLQQRDEMGLMGLMVCICQICTMSKCAVIGVGQSGTKEVTSSDLSSIISPSGIQIKRSGSNQSAFIIRFLCRFLIVLVSI